MGGQKHMGKMVLQLDLFIMCTTILTGRMKISRDEEEAWGELSNL